MARPPLIQSRHQARAGKLVKIRPGLYRSVRMEGRQHQDLIDACTAIPEGVICLISALAYHGLTTTLPKEVWIAIPRNAYAPVMGFPCRFIRMGDGIRKAGVESLQRERQGHLRIYGKVVSVCQALHFRERIGLDLALEALRTYLRQGGSVQALEQWAEVCRIRKPLAPTSKRFFNDPEARPAEPRQCPRQSP